MNSIPDLGETHKICPSLQISIEVVTIDPCIAVAGCIKMAETVLLASFYDLVITLAVCSDNGCEDFFSVLPGDPGFGKAQPKLTELINGRVKNPVVRRARCAARLAVCAYANITDPVTAAFKTLNFLKDSSRDGISLSIRIP